MTDLRVDIEKASCGNTHIFFTGQAGFVFKSKVGTTVCVDLYLSDCVERLEGHIGFKRLMPKLLDADGLNFDGVIATHAHYDHFDYDSMTNLTKGEATKLFASYGCRELAEKLGIAKDKTVYVKSGDRFKIKDISVRCVSCDHGKAAPDAFGVVITVDGKRIYIAGDTCLHPEYKDEILLDGSIDVMIAPINGAYGNLNESECVHLATIIRPQLVIPCHYGMFAAHGGSPWTFCKLMNELKEKINYTLLTAGEHMIIKE